TKPTGWLLTRAVRARVNLLFAPKNRSAAAELLSRECGNNLPFCDDSSASELDRLRLAALKLSGGTLQGLRRAIKLAKEGWRALLMSAGWGADAHAHRKGTPRPRR